MTQSTPYAQWPNPPAPKKAAGRLHWAWVVLVGLVCFLVGIGCGASTTRSTTSAAPASSAPTVQSAPTYRAPVVTPAPVVVPQLPEGAFSNGVYEVGADVAPGKYLSPGPEGDSFMGCYVHIKNDERYIDQKIVEEGQIRITIPESAVGAELDVRSCQPFTKAD